MAANVYECMFLLDTAKVSGDVAGAGKQIQALLEKNQAEVLASRPWDERRLAYAIKKHKKGLYYMTYFRSEGKNLVNIRRDIALNEMILRSLMLCIHPKFVDPMLAMAKEEHALALQLIREDRTDDGFEGSDDRRGRRSEASAKD